MKKRLYWLAVIFSVLLTIGFFINCVGTFHADSVDWKVERMETD